MEMYTYIYIVSLLSIYDYNSTSLAVVKRIVTSFYIYRCHPTGISASSIGQWVMFIPLILHSSKSVWNTRVTSKFKI